MHDSKLRQQRPRGGDSVGRRRGSASRTCSVGGCFFSNQECDH